MSDRVLLQDQGESIAVDGMTWRKAKLPAESEGRTDGRYLER